MTARPVAAVVTADLSGPGGPGSQRIQVKAADTGADLGELWFDTDRDLVVGDRVMVRVDRLGWAAVSGGRETDDVTTLGYALGGAGLAGFAVLVILLVRDDRTDYRRRELRRDGIEEPARAC